MNTQNNSKITQNKISKSLEKLSSGTKINRAADDASGLVISEKMRSKIREMGMAELNVDDGISVTQTADGALDNVTALLQRTRELCVKAANGTLSEADSEAIGEEMVQLFDEVENITETTHFNGIQLFRGMPKKIKTESIYVENVINTPELSEWGKLDNLKDAKDFDDAPAAKKASLELALKNVTTAQDFAGKAFTINEWVVNNGTSDGYRNNTVCFYDDTHPASDDANYKIKVEPTDTLETIVAKLDNQLSYTKATLTTDTPPTIKFESNLATKNQHMDTPYYDQDMKEANGTGGNGCQVDCTTKDTLGVVDGANSADNKTVYPNEKVGTYTLSLKNSYTSAELADLVQNKLNVGDTVISFSGTTSSNAAGGQIVQLNTAGMSKDALIDAFVAASNSNVQFAKDSKGNLAITYTGTNSLVESGKIIQEINLSNPSTTVPHTVTTEAATVGLTNPIAGTDETRAVFALKIDSTAFDVASKPKTFNLNIEGVDNRTFTFYDSSVAYAAGKINSSGGTLIDVKGKTKEQILAAVAGHFSGAPSDLKATVKSDGTIELQHPKTKVVTGTASGTTSSITYYETKPGTGATTKPILLTNYSYLNMEKAEIPLDFSSYMAGGTLNKEELAKKGFTLGGTKYEFSNGGTGHGYNKIDISGCTTYDDLQAAIQVKLTSYTVTHDVAGKFTLTSGPRTTGTSKIELEDGIAGKEGLFDIASSTSFTGGADIKEPSTTIDFSSYNSSADLYKLRGTGFRVTCATCPSEYVNVIFRGGLTPPVPDSFEVTDKDGNTRTIKNIVIDISQVKNGEELAKAIADQAAPSLSHYTDLQVDPDNPAALIASDKRWGDIFDVNGKQLHAQVLSGVLTNFELEVGTVEREIEGPDEEELNVDNSLAIYVGMGHPNQHQWIYLHLPTETSLKTLDLKDPRPIELQAYDDATMWLDKVDGALQSISSKRELVGSDQNRLEHTKLTLQNAGENTTAAESKIRDTDMAKEMMNLMKNQVLSQAMNSMLAQANQQPQSILQLLQA